MVEVSTSFRKDIEEEKRIMIVAKKYRINLSKNIAKTESDEIYYRSRVIIDSLDLSDSVQSLQSLQSLQSVFIPRSFTTLENPNPEMCYFYSVIRFQFVTALYEMAKRLEKIHIESEAGYLMISTGGFAKTLYDHHQSFGDFDFQIIPHYNGYNMYDCIDYDYIRPDLKFNLFVQILEICNFINDRFIPRYINHNLVDDSECSRNCRKILSKFRLCIQHSFKITPITTPGTSEHREGKMMIIVENRYPFIPPSPKYVSVKLAEFVFDRDYIMTHYENLRNLNPLVCKAVYPLMKSVTKDEYVSFMTYNPRDFVKEKENMMSMYPYARELYDKAAKDREFWRTFV